MCGIAGFVTPNRLPTAAPIWGERMSRVLSHRGPDGDGLWWDEHALLAHRRLSIIDLSGGRQPLCNEDGTVWIIFNGEIYNHAEVRRTLEASGHRYRTKSDTETIVHAYEEWGDGCVDRLRGMFAFAIWDSRRQRMLLVRDRLGVKPLYYATLPDGDLVFASEIKALLEHPAVPRDWSPEAVDSYLSLLYVPAPATIYRAIDKLPAGHLLVWDRGRTSVRQYWDLEFTGNGDESREDEYLERLEATLREAVGLRLVSDVPLGAFLSGGIDSTAVVAYMAETSPSPPVTISVGFAEKRYDELSHAEVVANHLGTRHYPQVVTPDIIDLLPRLAWHFDEPFADSSAVPTYYVSQAARRLVTVALSGDGGDELWAGYPWHRVEHAESRVRGTLGPAATLAGRLAHALPLSVKGARALRHLAFAPDHACAVKHAYNQFDLTAKQRLYSAEFAQSVATHDPLAPFRRAYAACMSSDPLDRSMYVDVKTYLADDILTKVDRMSMAVSLEAREPLLDHRLLEFAATVPSSLKLRGRTSKHLLRRLLHRRVPQSILERGKRGFEAPIGEWLRTALAPHVSSLLLDGQLSSRGLFRPREVERLWRQHRTGRADHRHRLWQLVMLELWFREFIDRAPSVDHASTLPHQTHTLSAAAIAEAV
jgi:asparagine synthase (glutamine-hydrolysing)